MATVGRTAYPRFGGEPSERELADLYSPTPGQLSDQDLRRQITAATNKAESYNAFSKWLFFGGDGILSENDPEEQEKRMKFNELLANSLILQNAADITEALKALSKKGYEMRREDLAQLSPYLTGHVKRFGDYVIDLESVPAPLDAKMPALVD